MEKKILKESTMQFYKENKGNLIMSVLSLLAVAVFEIGIAFVLQTILDTAATGNMDMLWKVLRNTILFLGGLILVLICKKIFYNRYVKKACQQYKDYVFEHILKKSINSFQKESVGNYISMFSNDMASIENGYILGNLQIMLQIALFCGGVAAMAYLNWKMFLLVVVTCLLPILVSVIFGGKLTQRETEVSEQNGVFSSMVKDLLTGFPVIKSFKAEKEIDRVFQQRNHLLEKTKKKRRDVGSDIEIWTNLANNVVEVTVMGAGVYFAIKGYFGIGAVVAFIQLLNYVLAPVSELSTLLANRKAAKALIEKIAKEMMLSVEQEDGEILEKFQDSIVYENVNFGYEEGVKNLKNINLTFEKGKSYAVVGGSGSGKSTLLGMLLGYHDNYTGNIRIDGKELKDIAKESLYDNVSVIQQNVFLFDNTIEENITLFQKFPKERLAYAIESAGLAGLLQEKGNDYRCGENGSGLSGGEKQRISIARCLIRNTPILLMDEATAALDNKTSFQVENAILDVEGLTKIIITHKLNETILKRYDEIIVMNQAEVVEQGKFEELLAKKGFFYSLYQLSR